MNIGLFPLSTIVFPGSALPLHIFEERYKKLINDCWKSKEPFGINLSAGGKIFDIGCIVEIADIMKRYEDGKMDIVVIGVRRFKMNNFTSGERPYYIANIDFYDDCDDDLDFHKLESAVSTFNKIAENISNTSIKKIELKELDKSQPSFQIALKAGLTLEQKQKLIEFQTENERLELLINHLRTLNLIVQEADIVNTIIKNDGYFIPPATKGNL